VSSDELAAIISSARPQFRTATAYVAGVLRDAIIGGVIPEGTALRQDELAERFQVSRMPVREALRLLESHGLIEFQPHKGAVVAPLRTEEVVEIFDTRAALEVLAIKRSMPLLTDEIVATAASLLDDLEEETDLVQAMRLHRRFHLALYSEAGARLLQLIESQLDAAERYLRLESVEMGNSSEDLDEHRALLAACQDRDTARAIAILAPHIEEGGRALAARLEKARHGRQHHDD
jgi:DNA-binding GntR family transcriptional regulator